MPTLDFRGLDRRRATIHAASPVDLGAYEYLGTVELPVPAVSIAPPAPNPTSGIARVSVRMPRSGSARLVIYDVTGRLVRELASTHLPAGEITAIWDARDANDRRVPAGTYWLHLTTPFGNQAKKLTVVR